MKKGNVIFAIILLMIVGSIVFYRSYTESKIEEYISSFSSNEIFSTKLNLSGDITMKKIVKSSPKEVVLLVTWGEDEVYISIENWLTNEHDKVQIAAFDKEKSVTIIE